MRILLVSPLYWPSLGGGEQVVQALAERLTRDGQAVTVLTTDAANTERFWSDRGAHLPAGEANVNGVRVIRVPVTPFPLGRTGLLIARGLAIRVFDPLRLDALVRRLGYWMPHAPKLLATLAQLPETFDLIHGFNLSWESMIAQSFEYARAQRRPYIMSPFLHTGEPNQARVRRNYQMSHQRAALRGSQRVIVQTPIEAQAVAALGVDPALIVETGVPLDPEQISGGVAERFRAQTGIRGPLVAFIGRATYDKGTTTLVRAMQRLWSIDATLHCVIAGQIMPDFQQFMRTQPASENLHILGTIDEAAKRDLLAAADVVVLPSRVESFGIVYLEAWAYRKPVIGALASGAVEVIADGHDGYLVPFGDAEALAQQLRHLIERPEAARLMGEAGWQKLEQRYTWRTLWPRYVDIYRSAAGTW